MSFRIPLFSLNFDQEEENAVLETLRSNWISTGPKCAELEDLFKDFLNVDFALSTSSCTSALHLAVKALGLGNGDEVIVPSLTFAATVNAVRYTQATPVFADIKSIEDLTIDPVDIRNKITSKTKAIIVMHYAGFSCDMEEIMEIARAFDLKVIEDSSHSPLSDYYSRSGSYSTIKEGTKLGTIGDIGTFSFYSNKNISTGEGGMLVTNNEEIFLKSKLLRSHGMTTMSYDRANGHATRYDIVELGYNYRLDDIRASIGIIQMKKLPKDIKKREKVRSWYLDELSTLDQVSIPFKPFDTFTSNYIMPVVLKDSTKEKRMRLREAMRKDGIQTSVHYPSVHGFSIYEKFRTSLPVTEYVSDNEVTLPLYSELTRKEIKYVCDSLKRHLSTLLMFFTISIV